MSHYTHLSAYEKDQIADLKAQCLGPTAIGTAIDRDKSTVTRKLNRNGHQGGAYRPPAPQAIIPMDQRPIIH